MNKSNLCCRYYENQENQPLLLTESHKVFIFLQYNITNAESKPSNDYSQFNLEVFRYGESENAAYSEKYYKTALHSLPKFTGLTDIDKIYITTENPKFLSYVFKN